MIQALGLTIIAKGCRTHKRSSKDILKVSRLGNKENVCSIKRNWEKRR